MPGRFSMDTDERDELVRLALHGELDLARAEEVEAELLRIGRVAAGRGVLLDLRGLTFLDSSGLRVIISANDRSRQGDVPLTVVRGPDQVHNVLEITGMDRELDLVDDPRDLPPRPSGSQP